DFSLYRWDLEDNCKVDFQVYWFGNVDVWFDKMTVQTDWADKMFDPDDNYDDLVIEEVNAFKDDLYAFFTDEMAYSCLKSTRYIKDLIKSVDPGIRFQFVTTNFFNTHGFRNDTIYHKAMIDIVQPDLFSFDAHEIMSYLPHQFSNMNNAFATEWRAPNNFDYNQSLQLRVFGDRTSITDESVFQWHPEVPTPNGSYIYQLVRNKTYADYMQPRAIMLSQPQIHANMEWKNTIGKYRGNREPTNEEIQAQVGISIAHGTDGFSWFTYQSHSWPTFSSNPYFSNMIKIHYPDTVEATLSDSSMFIGLLDLNTSDRRIFNMYGQEKWSYISEMNQKIQNWKPHLDKINWKSGWSVHSEGANHEYIIDIKSIYRNPQLEYQPEDDPAERYWEIGFYEPNPFLNPATDRSKYFVAVNRRCVPETSTGEGDLRKLQIKFDSTQLQQFNNWKITDLNTGNDILTFNKNSNYFHNLGEFQPGEAKLYKLAPVMQEGGTLVVNEQFGNLEINCNDNVNNGGFNIDIGQGTTINFAEGKKIIMNGGEFTCGYSLIGSPTATTVSLKGISSSDWLGLEFNGCELIKINKTEFRNIKDTTSLPFYLTAVDCPVFLLYNSDFEIENDKENCGAVSINYISEPSSETPSIDITGNLFETNESEIPVIQVIGYAFSQSPVFIRWNTFTADASKNAVLLSNVTSGVLSNNNFNNYEQSINLISTYIDLFKNDITYTGTNVSNSGLSANSGSYANLSSILEIYNAGYNNFTNYNSNSNNIVSDNSYFNINNGYNIFDIEDISQFNFTGTFNDDYDLSRDVNASNNCFKVFGTEDTAYQDVIWHISSNPVPFDFLTYNCESPAIEDFTVVNITEFIDDTLWYDFGGFGGGLSSKNSLSEINIYEVKTDSLKLNLRKQNLSDVKRIGNELLNNFIDSAGIINIIQPVYFSTLMTDDTVNTNITALKTKLESIISSNGNNSSLVLRCNYFIQKCKVKLGEYQSALSGFQQIMQNFPYSWEGVVAGWDYSATQLLAGGGSGQGVIKEKEFNHELHQFNEFHKSDDIKIYKEIENAEFGLEELKQIEAKKAETFDDKITRTVSNSLTESKVNAEKELKKDEEKIIQLNNVSKKSGNDKSSLTKSELKEIKKSEKNIEQKRVINETIKPRKPESISEQINFVNNDIKKIISVVGLVAGDNIKGTETSIEYTLHQNYPNPFNPITKISFSLPKDVKVTLVIYDILGREIAKLVNNELKPAGSHTFEFNASKLSSGIYFYSLKTDDFKQTKRMVLIK
ncbi:MAG: T9SS type A sorting domain-containing protein, partial [Ignavibacteria bacterium]|nr:T9SS type A sorting domain-containing protein [Ignavibacteria bacterium]